MGLIKDVFGVTVILTKAVWETSKFVVKHTPEVIVTIAAVKREISGAVQEEYAEYKKEQLSQQLENEIKLLTEKKIMKEFLSNTIDTIQTASKNVVATYDKHIREKAMGTVDEKLQAKDLKIEDIALEDYEVMVNDAAKEIQSTYNKRIAQAGLTILGLDLLMGV